MTKLYRARMRQVCVSMKTKRLGEHKRPYLRVVIGSQSPSEHFAVSLPPLRQKQAVYLQYPSPALDWMNAIS